LLLKNGKWFAGKNYILLKTNALACWHGLRLVVYTSDDERKEEEEQEGNKSAQLKIKKGFPKDIIIQDYGIKLPSQYRGGFFMRVSVPAELNDRTLMTRKARMKNGFLYTYLVLM
jgi:hypothetical protein